MVCCRWFSSLHLIFYSYLRKVKPKLLCFATVSKTFMLPLMAGSWSHTQKVAFFELMKESPGWHPPAEAIPGSTPLKTQRESGCTGTQLGAGRGAWEGNGLSPVPTGQRREVQSQPRSRLLHTGNAVKVTYPSCSQQVPGTRLCEGRLWLMFHLFLKFLSCHVLVILKNQQQKAKASVVNK